MVPRMEELAEDSSALGRGAEGEMFGIRNPFTDERCSQDILVSSPLLMCTLWRRIPRLLRPQSKLQHAPGIRVGTKGTAR